MKIFNYLTDKLPKDVVLMIIWEYVDPIPITNVKNQHKKMLIEFKNPKLFAVHNELLKFKKMVYC